MRSRIDNRLWGISVLGWLNLLDSIALIILIINFTYASSAYRLFAAFVSGVCFLAFISDYLFNKLYDTNKRSMKLVRRVIEQNERLMAYSKELFNDLAEKNKKRKR